MMKRRTVLKLMAAPALMTVARPGFAQTKEKVTYAYLLDPAYDAVTWAMSNGKVASDLVTVEARGLAIPQLIQATSAKQYDVIMTAVIAVPPAAARGLELKVLSNKPTRVLEIIELKTPRPRSLGDPDFDTRRQKLVKLFRSLEQPVHQKETAA